jgi:3-phytase/alkaline phosphatase D
MKIRTALVVATAAIAAGCGAGAPPRVPPDGVTAAAFTLSGQFSIRPLTVFPPGTGPRFGGISGLVATDDPAVFVGITDDHENNRVYRLRLTGTGPDFRAEPLEFVPLEPPPSAPAGTDAEGIALVPGGNMIIVAEGSARVEPRIPPSIREYGPRGAFVRAVPVRDRYAPDRTGPQTKGVRSNLGFESVALTKGGRLFVAVESPLLQDGELTTFDKGAPSRILEYVRRGGEYLPAREFVYIVEPIDRPAFEAGLAVNGLVDLLAIGEEVFLALERSFVAEPGNTGRTMNRIRLFRIELRGAADVSAYDSLKAAPAATPVRKTLLLDLSEVGGLDAALAPGLDNFEAMALGPRLPGGRQTLILVSDDNFNVSQRTWFLQFAVDGLPHAQRVQ